MVVAVDLLPTLDFTQELLDYFDRECVAKLGFLDGDRDIDVGNRRQIHVGVTAGADSLVDLEVVVRENIERWSFENRIGDRRCIAGRFRGVRILTAHGYSRWTSL